jgi:hypothetical protein
MSSNYNSVRCRAFGRVSTKTGGQTGRNEGLGAIPLE